MFPWPPQLVATSSPHTSSAEQSPLLHAQSPSPIPVAAVTLSIYWPGLSATALPQFRKAVMWLGCSPLGDYTGPRVSGGLRDLPTVDIACTWGPTFDTFFPGHSRTATTPHCGTWDLKTELQSPWQQCHHPFHLSNLLLSSSESG